MKCFKLKEVKKAFEQDRKLAFNSVDRYDGDDEQESSILNIKHNGYVVNIGFYWDDKTGYVRLFMQSRRVQVIILLLHR